VSELRRDRDVIVRAELFLMMARARRPRGVSPASMSKPSRDWKSTSEALAK
jgi:hypothetical protein